MDRCRRQPVTKDRLAILVQFPWLSYQGLYRDGTCRGSTCKSRVGLVRNAVRAHHLIEELREGRGSDHAALDEPQIHPDMVMKEPANGIPGSAE